MLGAYSSGPPRGIYIVGTFYQNVFGNKWVEIGQSYEIKNWDGYFPVWVLGQPAKTGTVPIKLRQT